MSNKSLFSLAFIIGAATGSVVTWYLLKDKYEALAQEEIDSVKEVFLRREQELKDQSVKKTVAEGIKDADKEKPDLKEYAERLKKEGYTRYSDFGSDEEEKPVSEAGPYVIPPEQFGDDEEYERDGFHNNASQFEFWAKKRDFSPQYRQKSRFNPGHDPVRKRTG